MKTHYLLLGGLCFLAGCGSQTGNPREAAAIATITGLGGRVDYDQQHPEHPVIKVDLHGTAVSDDDLACLASLPELQSLYLGQTHITDQGLRHLQQAGKLKVLALNSTSITSMGLRHLVGLSELKTLNLQETEVSADAIAQLHQALPSLTIAH